MDFDDQQMQESGRSSRPGLPVLFVVLEFSDRMLGGSRSLILILKHLQRISAHVICFRDGELYETLKAERIPTTLLANFRVNPFYRIRSRPLRDRFRLGIGLLRSNLQVYRFVRREQFRIIHCNSIYDFFHSFLGAKLAGAQIIFNVRGTHPNDRMRWHWQIPLLSSSMVIVLSEEMRRYYLERVWPRYRRRAARKILALYSGVELEEVEFYKKAGREHYRQSLGLPERARVITYVGAIHKGKNQLEFIRNVVLPISRQAPDVLFCFVGDTIDSDPESGPYQDVCFRAIEELRLGCHIRFVGHQSPIYPWFIASDFSAFASTAEGLPRVMIESLACCRPVVLTAVTSAREVVEEHQCGFVVPHGDWQAMTERVLQLSLDGDLRAQMSHRAGEVARRLFDPESVARQYEDVYLKLAGVSS